MKRSLVLMVAGATVMLSIVLSAFTHAEELLNRVGGRASVTEYPDVTSLVARTPESARQSFIVALARYRQGQYDEAVPLLAAAEQQLPLLGDYAALYQAESLMKLKRYAEATVKLEGFSTTYPSSRLARRVAKLSADTLFAAGDYDKSRKAYQEFVAKHASGADSLDALLQMARATEAAGDLVSAQKQYRSLWLKNPSRTVAASAQEKILSLESRGVKNSPYTAEELLGRAAALAAAGDHKGVHTSLGLIAKEERTPVVTAQIDLRSGMAAYRQREYSTAQSSFTRVASLSQGNADEARFWLAKTLERRDHNEQALALYEELSRQGKQHRFADDALMEAAGLQRSQGNYGEAATLYGRLIASFPDSSYLTSARWGQAWGRYRAGDYPAAVAAFTAALKDDKLREQALYWLARSLERVGNTQQAMEYYTTLREEFPYGFYTAWRRGQLPAEGQQNPLVPGASKDTLPLGLVVEKPLLLAALGMADEARAELAQLRSKESGKKGNLSQLVRASFELNDYAGAMALFGKNGKPAWAKEGAFLWIAGYPQGFAETVEQRAAEYKLSPSLVYALTRAESNFKADAQSSAGALGLMQLMPATARQTAGVKGEFNTDRLFNPDYNIMLGTKHLRELLNYYQGDMVYAAAAYNAGRGAVDRWIKRFPSLGKDEFIESIPYQETREYVKKVYGAAYLYRAIYGIK